MNTNEENKIAGAVKFDEKNPPAQVNLPRFSPLFLKQFGERPLEQVMKMDGSWELDSAWALVCEVGMARVRTAPGEREVFQTRIQLKGEKSWH